MSDSITWLASLVTGRIATVVAILAVAAVGLAFLRGRVPTMRAFAVVAGCVAVASAPGIAAALVGISAAAQPETPVALVPTPPTDTVTAPVFDDDPHGGAAPVPITGPEDGGED